MVLEPTSGCSNCTKWSNPSQFSPWIHRMRAANGIMLGIASICYVISQGFPYIFLEVVRDHQTAQSHYIKCSLYKILLVTD